MINNPVLRREFVTSLRTTQAMLLGGGALWLLGALVALLWPAEGVYSLAAQNSHRLFILLSMGFLTLVTLCAPSFTAVAITREKERETYDLLYDTLLRPDEIIFGKFAAGVGFVLILVAGSLPMMGACYVLGGISAADVFKVYLIVTESAIFFGLVGFYCSAVSRSSYRSIIYCYAAILGLCGLTWVPSVVLALWAESFHLIHFFRALSPFAAVLAVAHPAFFAAEHPLPPDDFGLLADSPWVFAVGAAMGSLVFFILTYRAVARPPAKIRADKDNEVIEKNLSFPFTIFDPRKRKRMIGRIINVIAIKEMRTKAFGQASWLIRVMSGCFIASLLLAFLPLTQITKIGFVTIVFTCVALPLAIIILISPVLTASAITSERESNVFDALRTTRLSAWTIVLGKVEVAWFFTLLLLASTLPTFFVLAYVSSAPGDMEHLSAGLNLIRPFNFQFAAGWKELSQVDVKVLRQMGSAFAVVSVAMLFATVTGLTCSAFANKTSNATAAAYAIVLVLAVGTLVPYLLADSLPERLVRISLTMNPFAAAAKAVSGEAFPELPAGLWLDHLRLVGATTAALLVTAMIRVWLRMRPEK